MSNRGLNCSRFVGKGRPAQSRVRCDHQSSSGSVFDSAPIIEGFPCQPYSRVQSACQCHVGEEHLLHLCSNETALMRRNSSAFKGWPTTRNMHQARMPSDLREGLNLAEIICSVIWGFTKNPSVKSVLAKFQAYAASPRGRQMGCCTYLQKFATLQA